MKKEEKIQHIFDHWNSRKGMGNWKSHNKLSIPTRQAILKRLNEGYEIDDLCKAIDNYAQVLLGRDYKWTYAWTLLQFLTRTQKDNRKIEQLWRWLPGEFHEDDYLKPHIRERRLAQKKDQFRPVVSVPMKQVPAGDKSSVSDKVNIQRAKLAES